MNSQTPNTESQPLVSVVTPVYNGEPYLAECIESVLKQTYQNWDYTIVDNCSTDETLAIAQTFAEKDRRIRIVVNDTCLPIIQNHNRAIREISPNSKYCKMVFADDWVYPACIEQMVRVAEQDPRVGLVGGYTTDGKAVLWEGPQYPSYHVAGSEVCRRMLLDGDYVFGTMTSLLVRSDLVRKRTPFFNERNLHADQEACFDVLQESDFGFVHQVLTFSRRRARSNTAFAEDFDSIILGNLVVFLRYGPVFLNRSEYQERWNQLRNEYHRVLGKNVLRLRPRRYWEYHENTLRAFGAEIHRWALLKSILDEVNEQLAHPVTAVERCIKWWLAAFRRYFTASAD